MAVEFPVPSKTTLPEILPKVTPSCSGISIVVFPVMLAESRLKEPVAWPDTVAPVMPKPERLAPVCPGILVVTAPPLRLALVRVNGSSLIVPDAVAELILKPVIFVLVAGRLAIRELLVSEAPVNVRSLAVPVKEPSTSVTVTLAVEFPVPSKTTLPEILPKVTPSCSGISIVVFPVMLAESRLKEPVAWPDTVAPVMPKPERLAPVCPGILVVTSPSITLASLRVKEPVTSLLEISALLITRS